MNQDTEPQRPPEPTAAPETKAQREWVKPEFKRILLNEAMMNPATGDDGTSGSS